ncbi:hypothetical protein Tco_1051514, partial [Tanacetum coccineum]
EIGEEGTDEDEGHGLDDEGHGLDDESRSVESDGLGLEVEEEAVPEGQEAPSAVSSPISSPMISLTVPSPIASSVTTLIATILVDEDQFIEIGAQLELFRDILQDYTQRLDAMPPTLFVGIDKDVRELYTRSGVVIDEIFSQRLVLALEAWAGHVDTHMSDMSRAEYDDHRLVHEMLVQQAALKRELQEMRGRATALE